MKPILFLLVTVLIHQSLSWPMKNEEQAQIAQESSQNQNGQQSSQIHGTSITRENSEGMGLPPQGALELMHAQQKQREQEVQPSFAEEIKSGISKLDPGLPTEKPFGEESKEWLERQRDKVKGGIQTLREKTSSAADKVGQQAEDVRKAADDQAHKLRERRQISDDVKELVANAGEKLKEGLERAAEQGDQLKKVVQENVGEEGRRWMEEQGGKLKEGFDAIKDAALEKAGTLSKAAATAQAAGVMQEAAGKLGEASQQVGHDAAHKAESVVDQAVNMMKEVSGKIRQTRDAPLQEGVDKTSEMVQESADEVAEWARQQTLKLREGFFALKRSLMEKAGQLVSQVSDVAGNIKDTAADTARNVADTVKSGVSKPVDETRDTMDKVAQDIRHKRQAEDQTQDQSQRDEKKALYSPEDVRSKAKPTSQWGYRGSALPPQGGLELMFMQQKAREYEEQPSFGDEIKTGFKSLDPGFNTERPIGQSIKESWDTVAQKAHDATSGLRHKAEQTGQQVKDAAGNLKAGATRTMEDAKSSAEKAAQDVRQRRRRQAEPDNRDVNRNEQGQLFSPEDVRSVAKPTSQWGNEGAKLPPQGGLELMYTQQKARENEAQPSFGDEIKTGLKFLDPGFNTERPVGQAIKEGWENVAQTAKDATSGLRQKADQVGQKVKDAAGNVRDAAGNVRDAAGNMRTQAEQAADNARAQARTRRQLVFIDDEPLVAVAAGDEPAILVEGPVASMEESAVIHSPVSEIFSPIEVISDTVEINMPVEPVDVIIPLRKRQADSNPDETPTGDASQDNSKSAISFEEGSDSAKVSLDMSSADQEPWPTANNDESKKKRQTIIIEDDDDDYEDGMYRSSQITIDTYRDPYQDFSYQQPYPYFRRKRQSVNMESDSAEAIALDESGEHQADSSSSEEIHEVAPESSERRKRSTDNIETSKLENSGETRKKRFGFMPGFGFGAGLGLGPYGGGFYDGAPRGGGVVVEEFFDPYGPRPYGMMGGGYGMPLFFRR